MRAKRTDSNHSDIVNQLRQCGLSVVDLSGVGNGVPDILISDSSNMWLCELKSRFGKLTPAQQKWHLMWRGKPPIIAKTFEEVRQKIKTP